ncbi:ferredoxin [Pseudonocardia ailaonensis]
MSDDVRVWIEQKLCTGDGLCVQYAPEVFEFGEDGLAYVKQKAEGELLTDGEQADVPAGLRLDVIDAADGCPGNCIHVVRTADGVEVAGPDAA